MIRICSLFDGSGGFPLAGVMCGMAPAYAAEVEPYPIAVTRSRFPEMIHLGDVSKVNDAELEPGEVVTFGSPCQDLSVAGKRAGLKHEDNGDDETTRSGLFMEAVRIIKEMRGATNGLYPRFAVWENVPGAFSSNGGEDFRTVIEELIKIVEPTAVMPPVPKNGWPYADYYCGDGWSLAYRTFDAQYWGVPQRRRRIYLVADFRGECAGKVLFEREGLRGYSATGGTPWEATPGNAQDCPGADDRVGEIVGLPGKIVLDDQGGSQMSVRTDGKAPTLRAEMHGNVPCVLEQYLFPPVAIENYPSDSRMKIDESGKVQTLRSRMGTGGGNVPLVMETKNVYCLQGNGIDRADTAGCNGKGWKKDICYTLNTIDRPAVAYLASGKSSVRYFVRRLTPTECARLQGFPDYWGHPDRKTELTDAELQFWTDVRKTHAAINGKPAKEYTEKQMLTWYNKLHTDSAEYKMWGNGIALPTALYVMQGIADALKEE